MNHDKVNEVLVKAYSGRKTVAIDVAHKGTVLCGRIANLQFFRGHPATVSIVLDSNYTEQGQEIIEGESDMTVSHIDIESIVCITVFQAQDGLRPEEEPQNVE